MTSPSYASLVARDITVTFGDRQVLTGIDVTAGPGRPLGLIGENGSGKSTLLRVLAGRLVPTSGTLAAPADLGYLAQDVELPVSWTVRQVLDDALAPLHRAVRDVEELGARFDEPGVADRFTSALTYAEEHDAWDAGRRAAVAAERLGLAAVPRDKRVDELSGGQRSRLLLAALVTRRPTCLLLDEPTNHLDDRALEYLETFLADLPGVVVAASHDRTFLETVCRCLLDLDPSHFGTDGRGGMTYSGSFREYLRVKADARRRWETEYLAQREQLTKWRRVAERTEDRDIAHDRPPRDNDKFIYGFKGQNVQRTVSRRRRDAQQRVAAIERDEIRKPPRPLELQADLTGAAAGSVRVRELDVPGRLRVDRLDVDPGEHLLVTGPNGCGKSTMLQVLAGHLAGWSGDVQVSARRVALLEQDVRFEDPSQSVREVYAGSGADVPLRELGLVHPRDLRCPVGALSTGQRHRLALAIVVARSPDLLLLDEPTNHLSLALVSELQEALVRAAGTVVVASHDRWWRARWTGREQRLEGPGAPV